MQELNIIPGTLPPQCEALRQEVREFVAQHLSDYPVSKLVRNWTGGDAEFSRKLGQRAGSA
jgi:acyl-CoA dehydrogenase